MSMWENGITAQIALIVQVDGIKFAVVDDENDEYSI